MLGLSNTVHHGRPRSARIAQPYPLYFRRIGRRPIEPTGLFTTNAAGSRSSTLEERLDPLAAGPRRQHGVRRVRVNFALERVLVARVLWVCACRNE